MVILEHESALARLQTSISIGKRKIALKSIGEKYWIQLLLDFGLFSIEEVWEIVSILDTKNYLRGPVLDLRDGRLSIWEFKSIINDQAVCIGLKDEPDGRGCILLSISHI